MNTKQLSNQLKPTAPVAWRASHLLAFAEVPFDPNPFLRSLEVQRLRYRDQEGCNVVIHRFDGTVEVHYEQMLGLEPGWTATDPAFAHMNVQVEQPADLSEAICRVDADENRIEAAITDSTGAHLKFRLIFPTVNESGPIFIPSPPCSNPTQMRFLTLNLFRLVDGRTADLQVTHNGQELTPQQLVRTMPKHRLAARSGGELLCASLCAPEIETGTIEAAHHGDPSTPRSVTIRNPTGHLTLQLDTTDRNGGSARVLSRIGQVASAQWDLTQTGTPVFRLFEISQDWRPQGVAPTKHALRLARRYKRRNESWSYTRTESPDGPTSTWST